MFSCFLTVDKDASHISMDSSDKEKYFLVLDLGTTSTRANVIDKNFSVVGGARFESSLIQNEDGSAELEPEPYFNSIVQILREAISSAGIDATEIISLSLSCQRSTFITWDKDSGETFHNLITWKDRRAMATVNRVNNSLLLKVDQPTFGDKIFTDKRAFCIFSLSTTVPKSCTRLHVKNSS